MVSGHLPWILLSWIRVVTDMCCHGNMLIVYYSQRPLKQKLRIRIVVMVTEYKMVMFMELLHFLLTVSSHGNHLIATLSLSLSIRDGVTELSSWRIEQESCSHYSESETKTNRFLTPSHSPSPPPFLSLSPSLSPPLSHPLTLTNYPVCSCVCVCSLNTQPTTQTALNPDHVTFNPDSFTFNLPPTGNDFAHEKSLDVDRQVQLLIEKATDHENLCQCYIGWCPFW